MLTPSSQTAGSINYIAKDVPNLDNKKGAYSPFLNKLYYAVTD
ncbi:Uncharacterised protein [Vibrio furnissii]|nr:Uncharacterised protein [Vibrio furnissii]